MCWNKKSTEMYIAGAKDVSSTFNAGFQYKTQKRNALL